MQKRENNYAFIDSQNLHLSIRALGWFLDFERFRVYLKEKYFVDRAYIFIGYDDRRRALYTALQKMGYICVFKPTLVYKDGSMKGNCDADLVLHAMIEYSNYDRAVIVTGDGDFYCLVDYFIREEKLAKLLVPNQKKYSALLKKIPSEHLAFVSDLETRVKRKEPRKDETLKGAFRGDLRKE